MSLQFIIVILIIFASVAYVVYSIIQLFAKKPENSCGCSSSSCDIKSNTDDLKSKLKEKLQ